MPSFAIIILVSYSFTDAAWFLYYILIDTSECRVALKVGASGTKAAWLIAPLRTVLHQHGDDT